MEEIKAQWIKKITINKGWVCLKIDRVISIT